MRICRHCGVKLENDLDFCPLCDMETERIDDEYSLDYPYIKSRFSRRMFIKTLTFMAIVLAAVSLLINHLVPTESPWAFITAAAIIYVWLNLMNLTRNARNPGSITLWQLLTVSGLVFVIDYLTGWHRWSVNYVIPFLIMAAAVAIVLCIAIRPVKYRAYTLYQLVIAILGVMAVFLWVFGFAEIEWPVMAAAATSAFCFAVMAVFAGRLTRNELRKRFHT